METFSEARLLDAQVSFDELHLFFERHPLALGFGKRVAEDTRQPLDGFIGQARIGFDKPGDGVERIEQKMRIDLGPERFELGAAARMRNSCSRSRKRTFSRT